MDRVPGSTEAHNLVMLNEGYSYSERVGARGAGRTVLGYLSERYSHSEESTWAGHIVDGRVLLGGEPVSCSRRLELGELLTWNRPPWIEPEAPSTFAVLYRDPDLLAVAKPCGLAAMPGGGFLERTLLRRVLAFDPLASPVHRLGRGTSGITLFTRHKSARRMLVEAWQRGAVERDYVGLVTGHFPAGTTRIDAPLGPVPHQHLGSVTSVHPHGKPSSSHVTLIERRPSTSLVAIRIETGRAHQIRIHLAAVGFPLAGDPLYPPGGIPPKDASALPGDTGYFLHAKRLRFPHPADGRSVSIDCAAPPPLRSIGGLLSFRRAGTSSI